MVAAAVVGLLLVIICINFVNGLVPFARFNSHVSRARTALPLSTSDFKNGLTFEVDGLPVRLQEFQHVKSARGSAFVRAKIKNLISGAIHERSFRAGENVIPAEVTKTEMQYTYKTGDTLYFMNMETFEEQPIDQGKVQNQDLLVEGMSCDVSIWNDKVIDVQLPVQSIYTVEETAPNYKGNTATAAYKPAKLNSGATVNVPMFVDVGEKIIVSTVERKYVSRAQGG